MKAQIRITGGINSVQSIARKMVYYESKDNGRFNTIILKYNSIADAKKDIKKAYKDLKERGETDVSKCKDNSSMEYDAGIASIETI